MPTKSIEPTKSIDLSDECFEQGVPWDTLAYLPGQLADLVVGRGSVLGGDHPRAGRKDEPHFETYSSEGGIVPPGANINPSVLLAMDPPVHTQYRRMVTRSFVPRAIGAIDSDVRKIAAAAVADFVAAGGGDFVIDVATAIPFRVMAALTAVPTEAESMIMRWGNAIAPNSDPEYRPTANAVAEAMDGLGGYLGEQFEDRRHPGDDLFSQLLEVRHNGEPLPEEDLRGFGVNYLLGGTETTRNLIAQGLFTLLEHPDQLRRFTSGEVDAGTMVEELLRWVTPVLHHSRWPNRTHEIAGHTISAGTGSRCGWCRPITMRRPSSGPTCSISAVSPISTSPSAAGDLTTAWALTSPDWRPW